MTTNSLRVVHIGAGGLALAVLKGLLAADHDVVGVLPWNKREYKGLIKAIKRYFIEDIYGLIQKEKLYILESNKTRDSHFARELAELRPDVLVVSGWGEIIKQDILAIPRLATINVHPSYLPMHRGVNPIASVLMAGESYTGISFHHLIEKIDAGNIIVQKKIDIDNNETYSSLQTKIQAMTPQMVAEVFEKLLSTDGLGDVQNNQQASYFKGIDFGQTRIDWSERASEIDRKIRIFEASSAAYTLHKQRRLMIKSVILLKSEKLYTKPGVIVDKIGSRVVVSTGSPGVLMIINEAACYGKAGKLRAKLYITKKLKVGDQFI